MHQRCSGATMSEVASPESALADRGQRGRVAEAVAITLTPGLLATIALLSAVAPFGTDLYLPVFPQVAEELNASAPAVQLTLTLFMVGMGLGQLCWGPIADRYGRRRPLLAAGALFVISSLAAPLAGSIGLLGAARFVQGMTGAVGPVLGRAIARDLARGKELARALSILGVISGLAPIAAPVLGGALADVIGWRGILWVLAGIAVLMLVCSILVVPETLPVDRRRAGGFDDLADSVRRLFGDRQFVGYTLTQGFGLSILFAFISGSSVVLQNEYGLQPLQYSLLFALNAVFLTMGGVANGRLVFRHDPQQILAIGLVASLVAAVVAATVTWALGKPPLLLLIMMIAVASACNATIMANTTTLGLERHGAHAGMASALMGAVQSAIAAFSAQMVAITGRTTAVSMTVVMAVSALLAGASYLILCHRRAATDR